MIEVTFTKKDGVHSLKVEGHAWYAEHGKDIICASASMLAYTLAQFVRDKESLGWFATPTEIRLDRGDTLVSCDPWGENEWNVRDAYDLIKRGYALLAQNYPQFVSLNDLT